MGLGPAALAVALVGSAAAVVLALRGQAPAAGRALAISLGGLTVALVALSVALVRSYGGFDPSSPALTSTFGRETVTECSH